MNNLSTLNVYYQYWDEFYNDWKHYNYASAQGTSWKGYPYMSEWQMPFFVGGEYKCKVLNRLISIDTKKLIPEPWWGYNDITKNLHSVVINFNPGNGGNVQRFIHFDKYCSYSQFMAERIMEYPQLPSKTNSWLRPTSDWHYKNRAKNLFDIIPNIPFQEKQLANHLSIELIPWHSPKFNDDIVQYAQRNLSAIIKYSIAFAAEASRIINNEMLHKVVIFRCSINRLSVIFQKSDEYLIEITEQRYSNFENAKCAIFKIKNRKSNMQLFSDITFISIWQPRQTSLNNFPYSADMKRIFGIV